MTRNWREAGAGEVIFVIAKKFLPDGQQSARAGFFQGGGTRHEEKRFILEADFDPVGAESALVLPQDAALGILHDLVEIIRAQFLANDPDREAADEFRLESVLDEILRPDVLENFVVEHFDRLGLEPDLALGETLRDLCLQALEGAADDKQNVTGADRFAFRFAAFLEFKSGLELALQIVRAPQRDLGFFH